MVQESAGIAVVGREFFFVLVEIAFVGAGLVVGEDSAGSFEFMINLGDCDDVTVAGEQGCGAADGAGELENFGVEDQGGVLAGGGGLEEVSAHGTCGGGEVDEGFRLDGHELSGFSTGAISDVFCCMWGWQRLPAAPHLLLRFNWDRGDGVFPFHRENRCGEGDFERFH